MNEEADMSSLADQISNQVAAGRETIEKSLDDVRDFDVRRVPPGAYVAAGMVGLLALGVVGWMIYRRSRRRTLVQRLQEALPDTVRELPTRVKKARSL
jgi:hypothetical protein